MLGDLIKVCIVVNQLQIEVDGIKNAMMQSLGFRMVMPFFLRSR